MNPLQFLRQHGPFDRLTEPQLALLDAALEVDYAPEGARLLEVGGPRARHLIVVRRGTLRLERDGRVLQAIEDGECAGFPSLLAQAAPTADVVAACNTLYYRVPEETFQALMAVPEFARHFLDDLGNRLRRAVRQSVPTLGIGLEFPVGRVARRHVVRISPDATIGEAAEAMRQANVSSLLVDATVPGILTDRDLRSRVLAEGRGPETLVGAVMTSPVKTVAAEESLFETLVFMLRERVHHAPVAERGRIVGIITDTDLLRLQAKTPVYLMRAIDRATGDDDLRRLAHELRSMVDALLFGGLDALRLAHIVAQVVDALLLKALRDAERDLGPPPCAYACAVIGRAGRREEPFPSPPALRWLVRGGDAALFATYAGDLATLVEQTLELALVPSDDQASLGDRLGTGSLFEAETTGDGPGPGMPSGALLATAPIVDPQPLPLPDGLARKLAAARAGDPPALRAAHRLLDARILHGGQAAAPMVASFERLRDDATLVAALAAHARTLAPPLQRLLDAGDARGQIDLLEGGIEPIAALARVYGLASGARSTGTLERLEVAAAEGVLASDQASTLVESFRFLVGLHLRAQLADAPASRRVREPGAAARPGRRPLLVESLPPLERRHLRDVFAAIAEAQRHLGRRFAGE